MKSDKLHALELSLTIGCRLDCLYCPQKLLLSKYYSNDKNRKRELCFEDFKIALDKVQAGATISFCGMSEPFHNKSCADMICYAYEKGYKISLLTTLVGMTKEDFNKIKDVKFDSFVLHIPDAEGHSHFEITDEYLEVLLLVNEQIDIDYYSCHGTVSPMVENMLNKEKYAGISLGDRAGNLDLKKNIKKGNIKQGIIACYHGSEAQIGGWTPVMFPDGSLVLCCQDYGMKHVLGNLITQSWSEICEGEEYRKFEEGLKDETIDILCRNCSDARPIDILPSMQLKNAVLDMGKDGFEQKLPQETRQVIERFRKAETVCVFGLGKLFRDHFFQEYWHEGMGVSVLADNNPDMHGKEIEGIRCIAPEQLKEFQNLLVVVFVKNAEGIIAQLKEMGIDNCILIDKLFDSCSSIYQEKNRKRMSRNK